MSMGNLLAIKFKPLLSTEIAPSTNKVALMEFISGLLGALLDGIWGK